MTFLKTSWIIYLWMALEYNLNTRCLPYFATFILPILSLTILNLACKDGLPTCSGEGRLWGELREPKGIAWNPILPTPPTAGEPKTRQTA
jgi:hypothetical protein